jgi:hypothetical protein
VIPPRSTSQGYADQLAGDLFPLRNVIVPPGRRSYADLLAATFPGPPPGSTRSIIPPGLGYATNIIPPGLGYATNNIISPGLGSLSFSGTSTTSFFPPIIPPGLGYATNIIIPGLGSLSFSGTSTTTSFFPPSPNYTP